MSISAQVMAELEKELDRVAQEVADDLRASANVDTGQLRGSITVEKTGPISRLVRTNATAKNGVKYASIVNSGRGEVEPKDAPFLVFRDGTRHMYSSPYGGSGFADKVVSRHQSDGALVQVEVIL